MVFGNENINPNEGNIGNEGLAIDVANVNTIGKSSVQLLKGNIVIKSYESDNTIKKPIDEVDFLIYSKGNYIIDDKIYIGVSGQQYEITSKNNEHQLRTFYNKLVMIKDKKYSSAGQNTSDPSDNSIVSALEEKRFTDNMLSSSNNDEETNLSVSEEIRNFYNLMKEGIISEEEFEEKKKELLNKKIE